MEPQSRQVRPLRRAAPPGAEQPGSYPAENRAHPALRGDRREYSSRSGPGQRPGPLGAWRTPRRQLAADAPGLGAETETAAPDVDRGVAAPPRGTAAAAPRIRPAVDLPVLVHRREH